MVQSSQIAQAGPVDALQHVRTVVSRSGSSFTWGMRILPRERREAMYAIYAFCREVDDIADEPASRDWKLTQLADWRLEIDRLYAGRPSRPTTRALVLPIRDYGLPKEEFLAIIDGMEMDARESMVGPSWSDFELYCRRVAGAVGMLSIRAFGATEQVAPEIAITLGEALQFTNILRDVDEDAAEGRLYLPSNLLEQAGIETRVPTEVLAHPALAKVCVPLSMMARQRFERSRRLIDGCNRRRLKPCILMMEVYERVLHRLEHRGWAAPRERVKVPRLEKLWIAFRYGLF